MKHHCTSLNHKKSMSKIILSLFFSKKINQLGSMISVAFLCIFCLAFTSPDDNHNNTFTFLNIADNVTGINTLTGPTGSVDLAAVLTTSTTFVSPGSQVDFTITGGDLDQEYDDLIMTHSLVGRAISIPSSIACTNAVTSEELSEGLHTIIYTETGNNCPTTSFQGTVSCVACVPYLPVDTVGVIATNCAGIGNFCLNISTANIFEYQILVDRMAYSGSLMACNYAGSNDGTDLQLNVGLHEVIFTQITTACSDTVLVEVTCPPCGSGFLNMDSVILGISDCAGTTPLCLDIPFGEIAGYNITDNGLAYSNGFVGCNFDTSYSYNYFALPAQGAGGPYNVDLWTVNDSIYSGVFMTIADLVDSMNVWDMAGTWVWDAASFKIVGGNIFSNYGNLTITQDGTGAFALLELTESLTPNGAQILIGDGPHELIFSDTTTLCQDTIQATVFCLIPEVVMDTIIDGEMDTYCVDTTELLGNIVSIINVCPTPSGNMVAFEIVDSTYCVNYLGLALGEDIACMVVCDDLGLCDTTTIIVNVLVDTLAPPVAVADIDTTMMDQSIVTNLLGNDSINGIFDTMYILTPPSNGTVVTNGDGTATYIPNEGYCNATIPDSYTYVLCSTTGCDSTLVTTLVLCESSGELAFYSGFSPNGDGINDLFDIQGVEAFPNNVLFVFNRWGNRVYYKEGYDNTFNGTWENARLLDGTYFYVFDDGEGNRYSGYVQIAR
jgi:gliding motility-associated-like protein